MAQFKLKVQPRSSRNLVKILDDGSLKVWVHAPPVEGKANEAVIQCLAKRLRVSPSAVSIASGLTSSHKTVVIDGLDEDTCRQRLSQADTL